MPRFALYAGVWNPSYQGSEEFDALQQATDRARELAIEEYESYEGSHGILSYDECCEDACDSWPEETKHWNKQDFDDFYHETVENTISYYAKETI